jgi:hypothetical protein
MTSLGRFKKSFLERKNKVKNFAEKYFRFLNFLEFYKDIIKIFYLLKKS